MNKKLVAFLCIATLLLVLNDCGPSQVPASQSTAAHNVYAYSSLQTKISTDTSSAFLQGNAMGESIAQTSPTIDFGVTVIDARKYSTDYGDWGNVVRGPDGKYYFGMGTILVIPEDLMALY